MKRAQPGLIRPSPHIFRPILDSVGMECLKIRRDRQSLDLSLECSHQGYRLVDVSELPASMKRRTTVWDTKFQS